VSPIPLFCRVCGVLLLVVSTISSAAFLVHRLPAAAVFETKQQYMLIDEKSNYRFIPVGVMK
jgi:hypothetical protein